MLRSASMLRLLIVAVLVSVMVAPAAAQERERREAVTEQERREAQRRVEEARRQLETALRQLQQAQPDSAARMLERAMEEVRAAQRELRRRQVALAFPRSDVRVLTTPRAGAFALFDGDRPRIGVIVQTESSTTDSVGARITAVTPGGPAEEAGLKPNDVVITANGVALARTGRTGETPGERFVEMVRGVEEGDSLRVTYRRGNQTLTAVIVPRRLGGEAFAYVMTDSMRWNRPDIDVHVEPWIEPGAIANLTDRIVSNIRIPASWLDAELVTLNPELGEYFGTTKGILVVRAPREGTLGLRSGDVILSIGGREPSSPSHALRILRSYEAGERVNIEVMREKRRQTVTATVPERDH